MRWFNVLLSCAVSVSYFVVSFCVLFLSVCCFRALFSCILFVRCFRALLPCIIIVRWFCALLSCVYFVLFFRACVSCVGSPHIIHHYSICPRSHAPATAQLVLRHQPTTTAAQLFVCEKSWKRRGPGNGAFLWLAVVLEPPGVGKFGHWSGIAVAWFREHGRQVNKRNQIKARRR